MSYSKEVTLWCDGCPEFRKFSTSSVTEARKQAVGWSTGASGDYCPECSGEE